MNTVDGKNFDGKIIFKLHRDGTKINVIESKGEFWIEASGNTGESGSSGNSRWAYIKASKRSDLHN